MDMEQLREKFGKREEGQNAEKRKKPTIKKDQLVILILAGILLLVITVPLPEKKGEQVKEAASEKEVNSNNISDTSYELRLARGLESALACVDGVGNAKVMITLKSSGEQVIEKDRPYSRSSTNETDANGGTRTVTDTTGEETTVYTTDAQSMTKPYVVKELEPEIQGIMVIIQGGDNPYIISEVTAAVQALFPVEAHKIKIMKMK